MGELSKRITVAVFGIPVVSFLIYLGDWWFFLLITIIAVIAQWEFYQLIKKINISPHIYTGILSGILFLLIIQTENYNYFVIIAVFTVLVVFASEMFRNASNAAANIGSTISGIVYLPFLLSFLIEIRRISDQVIFPQVSNSGFILVMTILLSMWICDTCAYGFGTKFGKHRLFEKVSPKKSVEGAVAGYIGAIPLFIIVKLTNILPFSWEHVFIFGSVVGIAGQIGDLVESWFKRDAGVKDSSDLFPGHGGMLDRFDSLIFISPVMYYAIYFLYLY